MGLDDGDQRNKKKIEKKQKRKTGKEEKSGRHTETPRLYSRNGCVRQQRWQQQWQSQCKHRMILKSADTHIDGSPPLNSADIEWNYK